jgi:hypothetical protein
VNLVIRDIDDMEHASSAKSICKLFKIPFQYTKVENNIVYLYTNINNTIIIKQIYVHILDKKKLSFI